MSQDISKKIASARGRLGGALTFNREGDAEVAAQARLDLSALKLERDIIRTLEEGLRPEDAHSLAAMLIRGVS